MRLVEVLLPDFWTLHGVGLRFEDGLTLITGANGAGKTALAIDAVAWALWGETVRGSASAGTVGATVAAPDGTVYRVVRDRKTRRAPTSLRFERFDGVAAVTDHTGQTPTETQARIDAVFGTWERHRATRVFSVRLAARFGSATDKERKALLESILGLERFERAADVAREVLRERRQLAQEADQQRAAAEAEVSQAQRLLAKLPPPEQALAEVEEFEATALSELGRMADAEIEADRKHRSLQDAAGRARKMLDEQVQAGRKVAAEIGHLDVALEGARARAGVATQQAICPTCLRKVDEIVAQLAAATVREAERADRAKRPALEDALRAAQAEAVALKEDADDLGRRETEASAKLGEIRRARSAASETARKATSAADGARGRAAEEARLQDELGAARGRLQEAQDASRAAAVAVGEGQAAVELLGSRGARTRRLGSSLAEVGVHANDVLRRLGSELRVKLEGTRKQASGKEVDEVSVTVEGAGGGEYDGVSDGERARLDLAILLGLAAVAGERGGMIAFDEVFDPLDDAGLEGVSELLEEMARERQVLVVTHSPRFTGIVTADHRYQVVPGPDGSQVVPA